MNSPAPRTSGLEAGFTLGPWRVDPRRNLISADGEERHLENRLMQTLVFMARQPGQVISRNEFFDSVWQDRVVNEEALSRAISLLRSALGDNAYAPRFIQTIPGVGYRLIADDLHRDQDGDSFVPSAARSKNSIAVLPFLNLSSDPDNAYFSEGISEEILNVLSQVENFNVVGRTSSFAFKGRNADLREVGKTLDVEHVLEGSVRKADHRVRITAQLIKATDGYHLWSKTYDRELVDIFAVQDEIASAVVNALKAKLLGPVAVPQVIGGTEDTKAFQAYLMGLHYRNRGALRETVERAIGAFQSAIDRDPDYARSWAGLAFSWIDMVWNGYLEHQEGSLRVQEAALKAIELAPKLASGHMALGLSLQLGMPKWQAAAEAINRALELNPGNAHVLLEYSRLHCNLGDFETSIAAARRALELDPVSIYTQHVLGHVLYFARRYEEAIPAFRRTLELDPHYPKPHYFIAMSLYWMGEFEQALAEIEQEPLQWMKMTASAAILYKLGRTEEFGANFDTLRKRGIEDNNFIQQADIYAQLGDADRAIEALETAKRYGDPGITQLLVDPFLDPIRDDPRFQRIFAEAGFGTR